MIKISRQRLHAHALVINAHQSLTQRPRYRVACRGFSSMWVIVDNFTGSLWSSPMTGDKYFESRAETLFCMRLYELDVQTYDAT